MLLARMLIGAREGKQLRRFGGLGSDSAGKSAAQFLDAPLEIYRGVPFFVARTDVVGTGIPPTASDYVEYLLADGQWRPVEFKQLPTEEIVQIAEDYLLSLARSGLEVSDRFRQEVRSQAEVPLEPRHKEDVSTKP